MGEEIECISELGIYGIYLENKLSGEVLINNNDWHLVRTKAATAKGGGVNSGTGSIGSLLLYK